MKMIDDLYNNNVDTTYENSSNNNYYGFFLIRKYSGMLYEANKILRVWK